MNAPETGVAFAARCDGADDDALTDVASRHSGAQFRDRADGLMPDDATGFDRVSVWTSAPQIVVVVTLTSAGPATTAAIGTSRSAMRAYCCSHGCHARCSSAVAIRCKGKVEQKGFEPSTPTLRTWCSPS